VGVSPFAATTLLAFGVDVFLGVFVLAQKREDQTNILFSLCCCLLAVVSLATFSLVQPLPLTDAELWARVLLLAASIAPALFLHTTLKIFGISRRNLVLGAYAISIPLAVLAATGYLHSGMRSLPLGPDGAGWFFIASPAAGLLLAAVVAAAAVSLYELSQFTRNASGVRRTQARYFALTVVPIFLAGLHDLLAAFSPSYTLNGWAAVPLIPLVSAVWAGGVAYLMRRYRLMDLDAALTRGLIRTFTFVVVASPFLLLLAAAERAYMGASVHGPFFAATLFVCALAASMVRPIRAAANEKLDSLFSVRGRDYRDALLAFSRESTRILELEMLVERVVETLASTLGVRVAAIYVAHIDKGFTLDAICGSGASKLPNVLSREHALVMGLGDVREPVVREELELGRDVRLPRGGSLAAAMAESGVDLALPLRSPEQVEGLILLGRRESGAMFSAEDIDVLELLASQVSIALENARLYADLKRSREIIERSDRLSAIGTMAAGLAHEIRNPLVSIRTFTQLLPERIGDAEFRDQFLDLTLSEVDRICLLINELLAFARPAPAELQRVDLNDCLERICLLLASQARETSVKLCFAETEGLPTVTADEDQVKQVVMNVILNAIQACGEGGNVRVATSSDGDFDEPRVSICVTDDGRGIAAERLEHIFDPFYTTRTEGTGLGLSIAHQIVARHGGSIEVETKLDEGTTFIISLPMEVPVGIRSESERSMTPGERVGAHG
jgi:signal transduction histidine kinase